MIFTVLIVIMMMIPMIVMVKVIMIAAAFLPFDVMISIALIMPSQL